MSEKQQQFDKVDGEQFTNILESAFESESEDYINAFELFFTPEVNSIESVDQYDVGYSFLINGEISVMVEEVDTGEYLVYVLNKWVDDRVKTDMDKIMVEEEVNYQLKYNIYTVLTLRLTSEKLELLIDE